MGVTKKTFMYDRLLINMHNNLSSIAENRKKEGYQYIDDILDSLRWAYENKKEDYLMNILNDWEILEVIKISEDYDLLGDYPHESGEYDVIWDPFGVPDRYMY